jgi:TfoX/Sxy family transcriptional regulator of competence genes
MAHNEELTNRVREALVNVPNVEEKRMFRGVTFMVDDKMCMSTGNEELMCRVDPALHETLIEQNGCRTLVMKGRDYRGYIYIHESSLKSNEQLNYWIDLALDYNKIAKATKKKKK